jgi:hypothetical protein
VPPTDSPLRGANASAGEEEERGLGCHVVGMRCDQQSAGGVEMAMNPRAVVG